jgi:ribonuclease P protein component
MLPKNKRIGRYAVGALQKEGKTLQTPNFSIRFLVAKEGVAGASATVIVSKKVAASAVRRNRLRRRIYVALRDILPRIAQSAKIMVFAKKRAPSCSLKDIEEEVGRGLGLLTEK